MSLLPMVGALVALSLSPAVPSLAGGGGGQHAAITIASNADFTACACVTAGSGTAVSPYVIGPWAIKSRSAGGWAVKVDNSSGNVTAYFNITAVSIGYNDTNPTDPAVWLVGVTKATTISSIAANNDGTGIRLDSTANITLVNEDINKGNGPGVLINSSTNIFINNSKLKATAVGASMPNADGIHATNSSNIQIGTSSACPPPNTPCVDVTYDDGFGIYFQNTSNSVINQTSADADDTGGFVLDGAGSFGDTVINSHANAGGPICLSKTTPTGYFTDLQGGLHLINGAHNNAVINDSFSADTGFGIGSGGNGFYFNPCSNQNVPFTAEAQMGSGNSFTNLCYATTDIVGLPPSTC